MYNEFKHIHNDLTVIFCTDTIAKKDVKVYIDTNIFHYINTFDIEWKSWSNSKANNTVEKFIGGTDRKSGKAIRLRKVIGDYLFGRGKQYTTINKNYCDLRQCNIFAFKKGTLKNPLVQENIEAMRKKLSEISKKEDKASTVNSNSVQIIEYGEIILILDNEKVVSELKKRFLNVILVKYNDQISKEEGKATTVNSNSVQIIEYGEIILILENEKVVSELKKRYLHVILDKYHTQLTLV